MRPTAVADDRSHDCSGRDGAQEISNDHLALEKVSTHSNPADLLTKGVNKAKSQKHLEVLGMYIYP